MAGSSTAELRLRRAEEGDLEYVVAAEAEPDNAPFLAPSARAEHLEFLHDPRRRHLVVEKAGRRVGFVMLRLHPEDRAVELQRLAVTEKGRGYGRAALRLAMAVAFEEHGAHRLWLDVKPHNERARSLYRSEGFVEEGLLRDALHSDGRFESVIVMSVLHPEWSP